MSFVYIHAIGLSAWIIWNSWPSGRPHADSFPFTFLTLVVSLEAKFLASFVLIRQNEAARVADHRSQLDLQINLLSERESTVMLRLLHSIAEKLQADVNDIHELTAMREITQRKQLANQIRQVNKVHE